MRFIKKNGRVIPIGVHARAAGSALKKAAKNPMATATAVANKSFGLSNRYFIAGVAGAAAGGYVAQPGLKKAGATEGAVSALTAVGTLHFLSNPGGRAAVGKFAKAALKMGAIAAKKKIGFR